MENKLKKYKIYSLRSYTDKSVIYYDYTMQFLHKRLSAIKSRYTRYLNNMDNYIVSFELFKLGNVYIELEEEIQCINREHLNTVLNKYIRDNDCLNKSYYDNTYKKHNDNINQQNQLTLYKSTPYIEEIQKDIKNINEIKNDDDTVSLTYEIDNINTYKNKNVSLTDEIDNINTLKKPVKKPLKEPLKEQLDIQPPTINNIKTIDIEDTEIIDNNNSIKSLASSIIKNNKNNKTIRIDISSHKKTIKKRDYLR